MVLSGQAALNITWTLLTGFLVMFMQAGFALVETGLTRAKNVAHTLAMNFMVYVLGMLGCCLFVYGIMCGGLGSYATVGGPALLDKEFTVTLLGREFGLF